MPDRYCSRCHRLVAATDWRRHQDRHKFAARERPGTTAGHRAQRQRVLERARHRCERCGAPPPLELHHIDGDWRNDTDDARVVMLCHDCHITTYRRENSRYLGRR